MRAPRAGRDAAHAACSSSRVGCVVMSTRSPLKGATGEARPKKAPGPPNCVVISIPILRNRARPPVRRAAIPRLGRDGKGFRRPSGQAGGRGTATPIMASRETRPANASGERPSVPSGRRGSTR